MVRNGHKRAPGLDESEPNFRYKWTTAALLKLCNTTLASDFVRQQQKKYLAHLIRLPSDSTRKQLLFATNAKQICYTVPLLDQVSKNSGIDKYGLFKGALNREF